MSKIRPYCISNGIHVHSIETELSMEFVVMALVVMFERIHNTVRNAHTEYVKWIGHTESLLYRLMRAKENEMLYQHTQFCRIEMPPHAYEECNEAVKRRQRTPRKNPKRQTNVPKRMNRIKLSDAVVVVIVVGHRTLNRNFVLMIVVLFVFDSSHIFSNNSQSNSRRTHFLPLTLFII